MNQDTNSNISLFKSLRDKLDTVIKNDHRFNQRFLGADIRLLLEEIISDANKMLKM